MTTSCYTRTYLGGCPHVLREPAVQICGELHVEAKFCVGFGRRLPASVWCDMIERIIDK